MMSMMQQLIVEGNRDSSGPTLEGSVPQSKNEARLPQEPNQGPIAPPFVPQGGNQELNPPKDKTSESGYGQVKSQVDILTEKILIIEGFDAWGNVDLDSLTNFL